MPHDADDLARMARGYTDAWNAHSPEAVASFYAEDGQIIINRGEPWRRRSGLAEMAAGFLSDFPDLKLTCDLIRGTGENRAVYAWTLEGHHAATGNYVRAGGWEEWELDADMKVKASLGWFDAADYQRQVDGG